MEHAHYSVRAAGIKDAVPRIGYSSKTPWFLGVQMASIIVHDLSIEGRGGSCS